MKVEYGQSLGIAGESGCGKSTIIQLLLRFYDPNHGKILISGIPIQNFTLRSLRNWYGLVQQEPLIFNTTVLKNIWYRRPHATVDEIKYAADVSNSAEFIEQLAQDNTDFEDETEYMVSDIRYSSLHSGYKTICGVKGSKLSGGQKQRIAIARAVVSQPQIYLFDEATSALDEKSQTEVQNALDLIMKKSTTIIIAHRESALSKCDKVITIG